MSQEHLQPPQSSQTITNMTGSPNAFMPHHLVSCICGIIIDLRQFLFYNNLYSFIHFSNPVIPVQGDGWLQPLLAVYGGKQKPTLDRAPFHCRVHSHENPHSLRLRPFRHASSPNLQIFVMWEETGLPRENLSKHGENVQTSHRYQPRPEIQFFPCSVLK